MKIVGYQPKRADSGIDVWVQITLNIVVSKNGNVTLMDVKKRKTSYCMRKQLQRKQRIRINQLMRASQAHKMEEAG